MWNKSAEVRHIKMMHVEELFVKVMFNIEMNGNRFF